MFFKLCPTQGLKVFLFTI